MVGASGRGSAGMHATDASFSGSTTIRAALNSPGGTEIGPGAVCSPRRGPIRFHGSCAAAPPACAHPVRASCFRRCCRCRTTEHRCAANRLPASGRYRRRECRRRQSASNLPVDVLDDFVGDPADELGLTGRAWETRPSPSLRSIWRGCAATPSCFNLAGQAGTSDVAAVVRRSFGLLLLRVVDHAGRINDGLIGAFVGKVFPATA